jgi:putative tryptophan/tyrosine transport system substrate-binding protein
MTAKQLALLSELVPTAATLALLINPNNPEARAQPGDAQAAAAALGRQLIVVQASTANGIEAAFAALVQQKADALAVAADPFLLSRRGQIVSLATRHAIPTIYGARDFITAGGLISYGNNVADAYRRAAVYTARILKGDKPGDLPVNRTTRFELAINPRAAKVLGLDVPRTILISADEMIESGTECLLVCCGTLEKCRNVRASVAIGGKPDVLCSA